jgi:hypothetical protein
MSVALYVAVRDDAPILIVALIAFFVVLTVIALAVWLFGLRQSRNSN